MPKLYELSTQYRNWMDEVESNDGELTAELEAELEAIDAALETKIDSYSAMIRQFAYEESMFREEAKRLTAKANAAAHRIDRMKAMLMQVMQVMRVDRLKGGKFLATIRKASRPRITWESDRDIPPRYQRVRVELDGQVALLDYKEFGSLPDGFKVVYTEYVNIL